jgi:hypothetical protein
MLFENIRLEDDEQVLTVVRKHWFIIFVEFFGIAVFALLPLVLIPVYGILPADAQRTAAEMLQWPAVLSLYAAWLLFAAMAAAMAWTHYYLDLWIITDRRIIVIDQLHFFHRKSSSFRLERLQDVKVGIHGIIATFLNFGTIRAQTASAAESNFRTRGLPDPRGLQATIQGAMDARLRAINSSPNDQAL